MIPAADNPLPPRWLACMAMLTVAAVCPLLALGALVTTMQVGMVDQRSVVLPHQAIAEFAQNDQSAGWMVEHSHRLAGWFAGLCGIGLAVGFWLGERRRGFRWLGLVALGLISCQGLLGIFRVALNDWWGPGLAWIHGVFAQIVFAALVGLALVVSRSWFAAGAEPRWRTGSLACAALVLIQLVLGGLMRHQPSLLVARLHMILAFVVLASLLWLCKCMLEEPHLYGWSALILLALVALQVLLGVEAGVSWMARYFDPTLAIRESVGMLLVRTAHYFVGSLLFATTAVVALKAHRGFLASVAALVAPPQTTLHLEGAL